MLTKVKRRKIRGHGSFAIIASRYNARYVDSMLAAAEAVLTQAGIKNLRVVRVPGAFEIPAVAARLARQRPAFSAIICLGVILRGQTTHAQQIADAVSISFAQLQVQNEAQAVARCLDEKHNRGAEAAQTALEMAEVMGSLD
jgi:6,7-dimethyl-8-ribityllumazine synthase